MLDMAPSAMAGIAPPHTELAEPVCWIINRRG